MEIVASHRYLRMSPRKVRLVARIVEGMPAEEAAHQLAVHAKAASAPILKTLRSAMANAKQNHDIAASALTLRAVRVTEGPVLKRFMPRAFGRATVIRKRMTHLMVVLHAPDKEKPVKKADAKEAKKESPAAAKKTATLKKS